MLVFLVLELGPDWGPFIIDSEEEFEELKTVSLPGCRELPLIGGSTNNTSLVFNYTQQPELYFPNNSGNCTDICLVPQPYRC